MSFQQNTPYDPVLISRAFTGSAEDAYWQDALESDEEGTLVFDFIEWLNDHPSDDAQYDMASLVSLPMTTYDSEAEALQIQRQWNL